MGIRLWQQSSSDMTSPGYRANVIRHVAKVLPDAKVDLHGVIYPKGPRYQGIRYGLYGEMLTEMQCAHNIVQAEDEGYDAFVYTCFNDPGLLQGRSMVDMPVVGLCETSMMVGQSLGRAIALIPSSRQQGNIVTRTIHKHRLADRVFCSIPMTKPIVGGLHGDGADNGQSVIESFEDAARAAIAQGADVLIPAEGMISITLAQKGITEVDGVRVMDSFAAALQLAKMLVELRKSNGDGVTPSRSRDYQSIPRDVARELARCTAEVLVTGWDESIVNVPDPS